MSAFELAVLECGAAIVQVLGLASVWLARISEGGRRELFCQRLFLACLGLVALATVLSMAAGPGHGIVCGSTLAIMAVAATCDYRSPAREAGTF